VHGDKDSGAHGITSRDCGLLAGVDVFLTSLQLLLAELAETMPKFETKFSQLVSSAVVEVATNTESTSGVTTTDGAVGSLSNSEDISVETAERKFPEQPWLVSVVDARVERNTESGTAVILANGMDDGLSNPEEKATADDEHAHTCEFTCDFATEVLP